MQKVGGLKYLAPNINVYVLIGASLSEPHIDEFAVNFIYIYIYIYICIYIYMSRGGFRILCKGGPEFCARALTLKGTHIKHREM